MQQEEFMKKIGQIEELARDTLAEFPALAKERLQMILALARYVRTEASRTGAARVADLAALESQNDDASPHSASGPNA